MWWRDVRHLVWAYLRTVELALAAGVNVTWRKDIDALPSWFALALDQMHLYLNYDRKGVSLAVVNLRCTGERWSLQLLRDAYSKSTRIPWKATYAKMFIRRQAWNATQFAYDFTNVAPSGNETIAYNWLEGGEMVAVYDGRGQKRIMVSAGKWNPYAGLFDTLTCTNVRTGHVQTYAHAWPSQELWNRFLFGVCTLRYELALDWATVETPGTACRARGCTLLLDPSSRWQDSPSRHAKIRCARCRKVLFNWYICDACTLNSATVVQCSGADKAFCLTTRKRRNRAHRRRRRH